MDREVSEYHEREPYYEDEIDLYQLIQVLLKRKKLIIGIFLVAVITAIVASYLMKPVYRVSAVVGPGKIYTLEPVQNALVWQEKDIDTTENLERLISQNPFHYDILAQLGWDIQDPKNRFIVKTSLQQRSNYISINIDSSEAEKAKQYLSLLLTKLQTFYYPKIKANVIFLNNDKKRIMNEKQNINSQIQIIKNKLKVLDIQSARLQKQIEEVKRNTEQIAKQRDQVLAKKHNPDDAMSLLLYSNTIQENLTQLDNLNLALENNAIQHQQLQQELTNAINRLANLDLQLDKIDAILANIDVKVPKDITATDQSKAQPNDSEFQNGEVSGIKVIQEPIIDPQRVSPKRTLMVAVAGVLGLFVGVFAAFAVEFWQSHKVSA